MRGHIAVSGGSIGGLFAALALAEAGWRVTVFEKVRSALSGRGAGIVTHEPLLKALGSIGVSLQDIGVEVRSRRVFDKFGKIVSEREFPQLVTSWDMIYSLLHARLPRELYFTDTSVLNWENVAGKVNVHLSDGSVQQFDALIGADGYRSAVRSKFVERPAPAYSGYVVWRAVVEETLIEPNLRDAFFDDFSFFIPNRGQVIGYPIPGFHNETNKGSRRYNIVWYKPTSHDELVDLLTDESGKVHEISIPPPLVRREVVDCALMAAEVDLPWMFSEAFKCAASPFLAPIYDYVSPRFCCGNVCLLGDAAALIRPHVGMGVTKAAEDALCLSSCLRANRTIEEALEAYDAARRPIALMINARSQRLGSFVQREDPKGNLDGASHPFEDEIVRLTATADF
ncbi:FAD-dependent oxidoreductase [Rhodobacterales bacterium HKCCA1058]|nr:FAD-dependent oxidoreductase [Rhodobacterales bacterium HKCCA1058]